MLVAIIGQTLAKMLIFTQGSSVVGRGRGLAQLSAQAG